MISEAIILAGGLGTRLRSAVPDLPKCLAPVAGKPFLHYLIRYFEKQGIKRFIFSLGYKHEMIEAFLEKELNGTELRYVCSVENEPLGTGGAIRQSATYTLSENILVINGDTFFEADVNRLAAFHETNHADCVLSLKPMTNMERYGVVDIDSRNRIVSFKEKQFYTAGPINAGVYALNASSFLKENLPLKFSFEKNYLETLCSQRQFFGCIQDNYFIDIGIPEDFNRANIEFKTLSF